MMRTFSLVVSALLGALFLFACSSAPVVPDTEGVDPAATCEITVRTTYNGIAGESRNLFLQTEAAELVWLAEENRIWGYRSGERVEECSDTCCLVVVDEASSAVAGTVSVSAEQPVQSAVVTLGGVELQIEVELAE